MLNPYLYYPLYLLVVTVLSVLVMHTYMTYYIETRIINTKKFPVSSLLLTIALIIFIGTRPLSPAFVDMMGYNEFFYAFKGQGFAFTWETDNIIFDNLFSWWRETFDEPTFFYIIIAAIYFGCMFWACKRIFQEDCFAALLTYLGAFSTFSYGTNGIKAGAAASVFLLAVAYRDKLWLSIILALVSWGFHHAMQLCVAAYFLALIYPRPKFFIIIWLICLFLSFFNITYFQDLFSGLSDETGQNYLSSEGNEWGGKSGFRFDFILYSFAPILMGIYSLFKLEIKSKFYNFIFCIYLLCNSIWMLCMYVNYTNRIAYLSWFLYPYVLIYPTLSPQWGNSRYRSFALVMIFHLSFTLFMTFIYYGISW